MVIDLDCNHCRVCPNRDESTRCSAAHHEGDPCSPLVLIDVFDNQPTRADG